MKPTVASKWDFMVIPLSLKIQRKNIPKNKKKIHSESEFDTYSEKRSLLALNFIQKLPKLAIRRADS